MSDYHEAIGEHPSVVLQSNRLLVNGKALRADVLRGTKSEKIAVSPSELERVLILGRLSLLQGIEDFYDDQVNKNPGSTIARPSIWTVQLGTTAQTAGRDSKVFTEKGYANGGVIQLFDEIQPRFHSYWTAITNTGFLPEVRRSSGKQDAGSWLLLRKPSLSEVLHHWFTYPPEALDAAIEVVANKEDAGLERRNLRMYRTLGERAVDRAPDTVRSRRQIGLILSMAAIKSALGDKDGYEDEVDDALTYAHNDSSIDAGTVRAIENSTF
ncbi:MAG: hypothetical protein WAZ21_03575 [Candidatus Saccharimonadales bacterium]